MTVVWSCLLGADLATVLSPLSSTAVHGLQVCLAGVEEGLHFLQSQGVVDGLVSRWLSLDAVVHAVDVNSRITGFFPVLVFVFAATVVLCSICSFMFRRVGCVCSGVGCDAGHSRTYRHPRCSTGARQLVWAHRHSSGPAI